MSNRILIIKLRALGDVLRTTCILPILRKKYKNCFIIWLTNEKARPLLQNNPLIDKIESDWRTVKDKCFDLVISLDEEIKACQFATQMPNSIIGVVFANETVRYTDESNYWFDMGLISKYGKEKADQLKKNNTKSYPKILINMLGFEFNARRDRPQLFLNQEEINFGQDFFRKNKLDKNQLVIGVNTDAGDRWATKKMSINKTINLVDDLTEKLGARIILLSESSKPRTQEIISKSRANIVDSGDNNLRKFSAIINNCDLVVTSDSLVLHQAIALGKKFICFFGPTSIAEIEDYGLGVKITSPMPCLCCYRKQCDSIASCIENIDNQQFIEAAKRILKL